MPNQGTIRKAQPVTNDERLLWAHDRMMEALRRAARDRASPGLVTAALERAQEYDELLLASRERQAQIERARMREAKQRAGRIGGAARAETFQPSQPQHERPV